MNGRGTFKKPVLSCCLYSLAFPSEVQELKIVSNAEISGITADLRNQNQGLLRRSPGDSYVYLSLESCRTQTKNIYILDKRESFHRG